MTDAHLRRPGPRPLRVLGQQRALDHGGGAVPPRSAATASTRIPAGIEPNGVNPLTLRVLEEAGLPADGLRSKSVNDSWASSSTM